MGANYCPATRFEVGGLAFGYRHLKVRGRWSPVRVVASDPADCAVLVIGQPRRIGSRTPAAIDPCVPKNSLIDETALPDTIALPSSDPDVLAGQFAHIVVDEAQELTDAEWQMLLLRCPSRSFTIVGDGPRPDTDSPSRGRNGLVGSVSISTRYRG